MTLLNHTFSLGRRYDAQGNLLPRSSRVPLGEGSPTPDPGETVMMSSVEQYGITWTFSEARPVGQYCNGDYFVVGPVTIININPAPSSGRNGTIVSVTAEYELPQAWDDRTRNYDGDGRNAGLNLPIEIPGRGTVISSKSLVASESYPGYGVISVGPTSVTTGIETFAILTVVTTIPAAGSFRPGWAGLGPIGDNWTEGNIDYSKLPSLVPASSPIPINDFAEFWRRWTPEIRSNWDGSDIFAKHHPNTYGDYFGTTGPATLLLCCNYTNAEKRDLLVRMIQVGIDVYVRLKNGGYISQDGAHKMGRKLPVMLAGYLLGDQDILTFAAENSNVYQNGRFQEDKAHFHVLSGHLVNGYPQAGIPEWASSWGSGEPRSGWSITYRNQNYHPSGATALAAQLIGIKEIWNCPAFFDYHDRCRNGVSEAWSGKPSRQGFEYSRNGTMNGWVTRMWETYRDNTIIGDWNYG